MSYAEERKELRYYAIVRNILKILSPGARSIIDVGSCDVDLLSSLPVETKICLDIYRLPPETPGVKNVQADWLEWPLHKPFDIVCCLQVLEHIPDNSVRTFAKKLINSGRIVILSVPYRWAKGADPYHCQDPVNEEKLLFWTRKVPDMTFFSDSRMVSLYFHQQTDLWAFQDALFQV